MSEEMIMLRNIYKVFVVLMLGVFSASCTASSSPTPKAEFGEALSNKTGDFHNEGEVHRHVNPENATAQIQLVLVPSEVIVGPNRFAVGIFDQGGDMVHEAGVHLHFYDLTDHSNPFFESEADAYSLSTDRGDVTIFAFDREFDHAGDWGVEVEVTFPDGSEAINGIRFFVTEESQSIKPGDKAPVIHTPVSADVNLNLSLLSSAEKPNPAFYATSLDESLSSGRPTLLLFATPAFCQTRFCGPSYEIFNELYGIYNDEINFIHVEVFSGLPNPEVNNYAVTPAMERFGLLSEPWVYLIDKEGVVLYRVEGLFTLDELKKNINTFLGL